MIFLRCYPKVTDWLWSVTGGAADIRWIPVYSYGFFVACGFMAAAYVVTTELRRREALGWMPALRWHDGVQEWTSELVGDFVIICAIFGILGSSFFNFLEDPGAYDEVLKHPTLSTIASSFFSGLSVFGGMICAGLAYV
jgi:prolipoprotein diacylglyceryltransferase